MAKGQEQVIECAELCRRIARDVGTTGASTEDVGSTAAQLEALAERLERLQDRFFVMMRPALRYTGACLTAAHQVDESLAEGVESFHAKLAELDAAVDALEKKASSPGGMAIT